MKNPIDTGAQFIKPHKEVRYLLSGASSEALEYLSFIGLIVLTDHLVVSNSISFIVGIGSGFLFHKLWSFAGDHNLKTRHQVVSYGMVAAANFLAANVIVSWFVYGLHMRPLVAKLISMIIIAGWSYLLFNYVIFRAAKNTRS
jgi:putative flippase GtrA